MMRKLHINTTFPEDKNSQKESLFDPTINLTTKLQIELEHVINSDRFMQLGAREKQDVIQGICGTLSPTAFMSATKQWEEDWDDDEADEPHEIIEGSSPTKEMTQYLPSPSSPFSPSPCRSPRYGGNTSSSTIQEQERLLRSAAQSIEMIKRAFETMSSSNTNTNSTNSAKFNRSPLTHRACKNGSTSPNPNTFEALRTALDDAIRVQSKIEWFLENKRNNRENDQEEMMMSRSWSNRFSSFGSVTEDDLRKCSMDSICGGGSSSPNISSSSSPSLMTQQKYSSFRRMSAMNCLQKNLNYDIDLRRTDHTIKTFLLSSPMFQSLSEQQLARLTDPKNYTKKRFQPDEFILRQFEQGHTLYILLEGTASIWKKTLEKHRQNPNDDGAGEFVGHLGPGACFGERAFLSKGKRAASVRADTSVLCIMIQRETFEEVLADTSSLLEGFVQDKYNMDQTRTLGRHIREFVDKFPAYSSDQKEEGLALELMALSSPELQVDDVVERMIRALQNYFQVEKLGLFLVNAEANQMILRISKDARGLVVPIKGIAGHTALTGEIVNVKDAYEEPRFDSAMDRKTGQRTRQLLCVPIEDPDNDVKGKKIIGVLQCVNRLNAATPEFTKQDEKLLQCAAKQLGLVLQQKHDVFQSCLYSYNLDHAFSIRIDRLIWSCFDQQQQQQIVLLANSNLRAVVTLRLFHGQDALCTTPVNVLNNQVIVDMEEQMIQFYFDEPLALNTTYLSNLPVATRVILDFQIYNVPTSSSLSLRRKLSSSSNANISMGGESFGFCSENLVMSGWTGFFLYSFDNYMQHGRFHLGGWTSDSSNGGSGKYDPMCPFTNLQCSDSNCQLNVELPRYEKPVVHGIAQEDEVVVQKFKMRTSSILHNPEEEEKELIQTQQLLTVLKNPFHVLTQKEKDQIWFLRHRLVRIPFVLPWFLLVVKWDQKENVQEAYQFLYMWEPLSPEQAIRLLGPRYVDPKVRAYAVQTLEQKMPKQDIGLYMLQLVQALRHERFHDSALARFLLRNALKNPQTLGHQFFWLLKAELHQSNQWISGHGGGIRIRYGVLLDIFLRFSNRQNRLSLGHQVFVLKKIAEIFLQVKQVQTLEEKNQMLKQKLKDTMFPHEFVLPLDPTKKICGIYADKCRVLGSKQKPFYLVFRLKNRTKKTKSTNQNSRDEDEDGDKEENNSSNNNTEDDNDDTTTTTTTPPPPPPPTTTTKQGGEEYHVMYKSGDDLRQDQLILQLFRVFDRLWQRSNLNLCLVSYGCIATGNRCGLIEVVQDSETIANLFSARTQQQHGSQRGSPRHKIRSALGVFTEQKALEEWLLVNNLPCSHEHQQVYDKLVQKNGSNNTNSNSQNKISYEQVVDNFARSCAASCIATYVLGIGDRHNDNIMLSRHGKLFHIDFGHILGNFKKKFGVKRERTMFVFTPAFASVLSYHRKTIETFENASNSSMTNTNSALLRKLSSTCTNTSPTNPNAMKKEVEENLHHTNISSASTNQETEVDPQENNEEQDEENEVENEVVVIPSSVEDPAITTTTTTTTLQAQARAQALLPPPPLIKKKSSKKRWQTFSASSFSSSLRFNSKGSSSKNVTTTATATSTGSTSSMNASSAFTTTMTTMTTTTTMLSTSTTMKRTVLGSSSSSINTSSTTTPRSPSAGSITTVYSSSKDLSVDTINTTTASTSTSSTTSMMPYLLFQRLACDGYNVLRHHVDLLYDLCMIMTSGELSELKNEQDLHWIQLHTLIEESDANAEKHFKKLIKHSLNSRATLLNDAAHLLKHG